MQHIRVGRIDWRLFAWNAPPSPVGTVVGGLASGRVAGNALLFAIGVTLLDFGIDLLRPRSPTGSAGEHRISVREALLTGAAIGRFGELVGLILGSLRIGALLRFVASRA